LCKTLIADFTDTNYKIALAIIGRRNEEVHSGGAAFSEYPTQQWIAGFYKCCKILSESQGENLTTLLGEEIAKEAELIQSEIETKVFEKTKSLIAAHKKVFETKEEDERILLTAEAVKKGELLAHREHHRVSCPACSCVATVQGESYGKDQIENKEDEIIVRQSIVPTKFVCSACGLKLNGYGELSSAGIADHYTRRINYTPEDFYEMVNPEDRDSMAAYAEEHGFYEFNND
jgi:hypothetical protein